MEHITITIPRRIPLTRNEERVYNCLWHSEVCTTAMLAQAISSGDPVPVDGQKAAREHVWVTISRLRKKGIAIQTLSHSRYKLKHTRHELLTNAHDRPIT